MAKLAKCRVCNDIFDLDDDSTGYDLITEMCGNCRRGGVTEPGNLFDTPEDEDKEEE